MSILFVVGLCCAVLLVAIPSWWAHRTWGTPWQAIALRGLALIPVAALFSWGFNRLAQNARLQFEETRHGYELAAVSDTIRCSRDGPCRYSYQCDPYIVQVSYQDCRTDSKGNRSCTTRYRPETRYHDCPYCRFEVGYSVTTTLGDFSMGRTLPASPNNYRWRAGESVPRSLPSGDPDVWTAARQRELAFRPGPVAQITTYDNYLLASEHTVLRKWSGRVRQLDSLGALPRLTSPITGHYDQARLVVAPAFKRPLDASWRQRVDLLAAMAGPLRQGSLLVAIVPATVAGQRLSPNDYATAIQAHWQDEGTQGRHALPKNLVAFVLGVEGDTVRWGRVITGMPDGNDALKNETRLRFTNQPFTPDHILGRPVITPAGSPLAAQVLADLSRAAARDTVATTSQDSTGLVGRVIAGATTGGTGGQATPTARPGVPTQPGAKGAKGRSPATAAQASATRGQGQPTASVATATAQPAAAPVSGPGSARVASAPVPAPSAAGQGTRPTGTWQHQRALFLAADGLLPDLLFGRSQPSTAFVRTSMTGKTGKGTGYAYLKEEIRPTTAGWAWSLVGMVVGLSVVWWGLFAVFPPEGVAGHWGIPAGGVSFRRSTGRRGGPWRR